CRAGVCLSRTAAAGRHDAHRAVTNRGDLRETGTSRGDAHVRGHDNRVPRRNRPARCRGAADWGGDRPGPRGERVTADRPAPLVVGPLTRTDIVRYQGASGDMNPLHHDETFARAAGYNAPLAIGMLGAGLLATYATDWLGAENIRRFRIRFRAQVW